MTGKENTPYLTVEKLSQPALKRLNDIAWENCGIGLMVVFPSSDGWKELYPGDRKPQPTFCQLIQSSGNGDKHCKTCHLLISIAAGEGGETEPRCHAGAFSLTAPIPGTHDDRPAVVSTCMITPGREQDVLDEARRRGNKIGVPDAKIRKACESLPRLSGEKLVLAHELIATAAEVVGEIWKRVAVEHQFAKMRQIYDGDPEVQSVVERELRLALRRLGEPGASSRSRHRKSPSLLVEIVSDLVRRRPHMPFTLAEIAAAARVTPNHFSHTFRKHQGQLFSTFVTEQRITRAKELLKDLTLNIAEVSTQSGFEDPGYFARRFRQKTGKSPREWRSALSLE